ncbi:putative polyprenyl diphosphate synthase [Streptomyces sp. NBRC 110611]|nr:putative polyprenyl diphosphate synthase [Streptomyces sp. NBRC 110611]
MRARVDNEIEELLAAKARIADLEGMPYEVADALRVFLAAGGKRIRPQLCVLGWHAGGGHGHPDTVIRVAASLEIFHAFALIRDDVMDNSDTRGGQPTVHRALAAGHAMWRTPRAARRLGEAGAILVGDFALAWAAELLHSAGLSSARLQKVLPLVDTMRSEVLYGQYLDVTGTASPHHSLERAFRIIRYKTAKYTVERPLHIGALLAGADGPLLDGLSAFALPLGEAFQLRDDLLVAFGSPQQAGKPAIDDLREGKPTVLFALALQHAQPSQARRLRFLYGDPQLDEDGAAELRGLLTATGAGREVERMITARYEQATAELDSLSVPAGAMRRLRELAGQVALRTA